MKVTPPVYFILNMKNNFATSAENIYSNWIAFLKFGGTQKEVFLGII
jgi:hypothetical protein